MKIFEVNVHGDEHECEPTYYSDRESADEAIEIIDGELFSYILEIQISDDVPPERLACLCLNGGWLGPVRFVWESVPGSYAYYWSYEYRHYLRDAVPSRRVAVLEAFLAAGLDPEGCSHEHERIVVSITAPEELAK